MLGRDDRAPSNAAQASRIASTRAVVRPSISPTTTAPRPP